MPKPKAKTKKSKVKKIRGTCVNCPKTEDVLALDTVLYYGFGGYSVKKNGKLYFEAKPNTEWQDFPTLEKFEILARKEKAKWEVVLNNPLRGATWQRATKNIWVLRETNQGFA